MGYGRSIAPYRKLSFAHDVPERNQAIPIGFFGFFRDGGPGTGNNFQMGCKDYSQIDQSESEVLSSLIAHTGEDSGNRLPGS